jgi:predicted acylesterase/phospholipase RssA
VGAGQALAEAEIRPAGIVGTSIGGLIGALGASAMGHKEGLRLARELTRSDIARVNRRALWINGIRQESVFRGDVLRDYFETLLPPAGWAALETPFLVNAVDLANGSVEWFGTGARQDVVGRASALWTCGFPSLPCPSRVGASRH